MLTDLRFAFRSLANAPGFTAACVLTLALGIGATTTMFSALHAVVLRPLPYADPASIVRLWATMPTRGHERVEVSLPRLRLLQESTGHIFTSIGASAPVSFTVTGRGEPEHVAGLKTSGAFLSTLGVAPLHGRSFSADEDRTGGAPVVLLSHRYAARRFGHAASAVGGVVTLDGQPHSVIGVLPERFTFPLDQANVWVPRAFETNELTPAQVARGAGFLTLTARLRPGVTLTAAQAALDAAGPRYAAAHPGFMDVNFGLRALPFAQEVAGAQRPKLLLLFAAVTLVLVIACANVTHLFLARSQRQQREIAIRLAIGGTAWQIVRRYLSEGLLVAGAASLLGVLLAAWSVPLVQRLAGVQLPRGGEIGIDGTILAFAAGVALVTGLALGLMPLRQVARVRGLDALRAGNRSPGSGRDADFRAILLTGEVALSMALLTGAALLILSFVEVRAIRPGFQPDDLYHGTVLLPKSRYADETAIAGIAERIADGARAQPGVTHAAVVLGTPFTTEGSLYTYAPPERPQPDPKERQLSRYCLAGPGYFAALGAALVDGREFTAADRIDAPRVVVINETMARRLYPAGGALGREVVRVVDQSHWRIVGIVRDFHSTSLIEPPPPETYFPFAQEPSHAASFIVRSATNPGLAAQALRSAVRATDPQLTLSQAGPVPDLVSRSLADRRLALNLLLVFAGLAVGLAAVGMASTTAYLVAQRTHEIGVRLALGASPDRIVRMILGESLRPVVVGLFAGALLSLALAQALAGQFVAVEVFDARALAATALVVVITSAFASGLPARRATRVDPMVALRAE